MTPNAPEEPRPQPPVLRFQVIPPRMQGKAVPTPPTMWPGNPNQPDQWHVGIFECCKNPMVRLMGELEVMAFLQICICGWYCPCYVAFKAAPYFEQHPFIWCMLTCLLPCITPAGLRYTMREHQNIEGNIIEDCLCGCCCSPCALCQVANEVENRLGFPLLS